MIHLVTGGSGSGKSAYAEDLFALHRQTEKPFCYIATMIPYGNEAKERIRRHQKLRAGKGFQTLECYRNLETLVLPKNDGILLECMSNLVANEWYKEDGSLEQTDVVMDAVRRGIAHLAAHTNRLVIVTNEVNAALETYGSETQEYCALLGAINAELGHRAQTVTEVVYGIPIPVKGGTYGKEIVE